MIKNRIIIKINTIQHYHYTILRFVYFLYLDLTLISIICKHPPLLTDILNSLHIEKVL